MSYRESIIQSIEETQSIIEKTRKHYASSNLPAFIADLELGSLRKRLEELRRQLAEIEAVQDREELKVKFHPVDLPSGKVPARTLTNVLLGIQNISDSIANAKYNQPSSQGRIPSDLLNRHSFLVIAQEAGSFEVTLEMNHDEQLSIEEPSQTSTVAELFSLFTCSNDSNLLFETVSRLGPRALAHYKTWTKFVKDDGTAIDVIWTSANRGTNYVYFDSTKAARIFEVLNNIAEEHPIEVEVMGRLTGADSRSKSFKFETQEGAFISGAVVPEKVPKVNAVILESLCKATLLKYRTIYNTTGKEKTTWILQDIEVIQNPDQ